MEAATLRARDLTMEQRRLWSRLQRADPLYASPFFSPEFTRAVAAVRDGVFVALVHERGDVRGFFPFQRGAQPAGEPPGSRLCDFQGVVVAPGVRWTAEALIRGCGLESWEFSELLIEQKPFDPYRRRRLAAPYMDLADGFDAYVRGRVAAGSRVIRKVEQSRRRLERDVGPLRFEVHDPDPAALRRVLELKSAQYRRRGKSDLFAVPWVVALVDRLHGVQGRDFAGVLSLLYAGDELVAAHFGLRSWCVWHLWFPVYDPRFRQCSPGLVLILEMAARAPALGLRRIDLGSGPSLYKERLMSGVGHVSEGCVHLER